MNILTLRTDKPDAELSLYQDSTMSDEIIWEAHRQLADTIHLQFKELLERNQCNWKDIEGIVCYAGPGSFTGLRIGLTVANTLSSDMSIPIVSVGGEDWQSVGIDRILHGESDDIALPEYGAPANVTLPKK